MGSATFGYLDQYEKIIGQGTVRTIKEMFDKLVFGEKNAFKNILLKNYLYDRK